VGVAALGVTNLLAGSCVYLDTNVWIYALEGFPAYVDTLQRLFARIDSGELRAVTSELTLAEALVKPLSFDNAELVQMYRSGPANLSSGISGNSGHTA
jgi:hypothetical protein